MVGDSAWRILATITAFAIIASCGQEPASSRTDVADSGLAGGAELGSESPSLVWRSFLARNVDSAGVPQDARVFEPGPVGYYMMASGANDDEIQAGLVADGRVVDECDPYSLQGDSGYFCQFEFVGSGHYEVWVFLNNERLETLEFDVSDGLDADSHDVSASTSTPSPDLHISNIPWRRFPSERDYERAYPTRALDQGISGRVLLSCRILNRGEVDCEILREEPEEMGFGEAALQLSRRFRMRTTLEDGRRSEGFVVNVPVRFEPHS